MIRKIGLLLWMVGAAFGIRAQEGGEALRTWRAAAYVTAAEVERFGIDNCFTQREIDEETFARMQGRSFKAGCTTPRGELRYLTVLHVDIEGLST